MIERSGDDGVFQPASSISVSVHLRAFVVLDDALALGASIARIDVALIGIFAMASSRRLIAAAAAAVALDVPLDARGDAVAFFSDVFAVVRPPPRRPAASSRGARAPESI